MSKATMRSDRKPPLPVRLLRPRRAQNTARSTPVSLIKTPLANRSPKLKELELRVEYRTISCEFQVLAKMVQDEFGKPHLGNPDSGNPYGAVSNPQFERGRFYDEYSARRNERLKRKRGQSEEEKENMNDLGVGFESAKKKEPKGRELEKRAVLSTPMTQNWRRKGNKVVNDLGVGVKSAKKLESKRREGAKRAVVSTPMAENRRENSRYMLRSMNKENKKPPLPVKYEGSVVGKSVSRRVCKS